MLCVYASTVRRADIRSPKYSDFYVSLTVCVGKRCRIKHVERMDRSISSECCCCCTCHVGYRPYETGSYGYILFPIIFVIIFYKQAIPPLTNTSCSMIKASTLGNLSSGHLIYLNDRFTFASTQQSSFKTNVY